jgi:hypothetical protein
MAVNHQVTTVFRAHVFRVHNDDGRLLSALSQQMAPAVRLTDSQVFPSQVELVKLQVHGRAAESEYAGGRDRSFAEAGEVYRKLLWAQRDTGGSGLSRCGRLVLP